MGLIGIKAAKNDFNAAIAKIVRKYRDMSLSEIKKIVLEGNYLYECDYVDEQGIKVILSIDSELNKSGIATVIYEHDRITDREFLNNLLGSYAETAEQVEEEMDREALSEKISCVCDVLAEVNGFDNISDFYYLKNIAELIKIKKLCKKHFINKYVSMDIKIFL